MFRRRFPANYRGENYGSLYEFPAHIIFMRRTFAVVAGVLALPVMLFWKDRARFYSYLHRVWAKTSEKPVWMDQAEKATCDFY
ncbi:YbfA family protein [Enterobacter hormaechei]|nr:YbfA family protein [Enterobacter hormaechei]